MKQILSEDGAAECSPVTNTLHGKVLHTIQIHSEMQALKNQRCF